MKIKIHTFFLTNFNNLFLEFIIYILGKNADNYDKDRVITTNTAIIVAFSYNMMQNVCFCDGF